MKKFKKILLLKLLVLSSYSSAQIVDVESLRSDSDTIGGFRGEIGASISFIKNTQRTTLLSFSANAENSKNKNAILLLSSASLLKSETTNFDKNSYLHIRYDYSLNKKISLEVFVQTQSNAMLKIKHREIVGAGFREKIYKGKVFSFYLGHNFVFSYLYE